MTRLDVSGQMTIKNEKFTFVRFSEYLCFLRICTVREPKYIQLNGIFVYVASSFPGTEKGKKGIHRIHCTNYVASPRALQLQREKG